jgi:hypothetical protein
VAHAGGSAFDAVDASLYNRYDPRHCRKLMTGGRHARNPACDAGIPLRLVFDKHLTAVVREKVQKNKTVVNAASVALRRYSEFFPEALIASTFDWNQVPRS